MATIRVNYDNVFRQAARLQQLGDAHRRAAGILDSQRAAIGGAWQDPAGAAYCAAASELASSMRVTADELSRLGTHIRDAAIRFRAQEEANAKAAKQLGN